MSMQSAINKLIGTAAAGAAAVAKISDDLKSGEEKEAKKVESGLLAKEQFHEAQADVTKLTGEQEEAEKILKEKTAISDTLEAKRPGGKGNTKAKLEQSRKAALSEKEAAQRAFDELADRIEAKKAMMERAQMIMNRTGVGDKK